MIDVGTSAERTIALVEIQHATLVQQLTSSREIVEARNLWQDRAHSAENTLAQLQQLVLLAFVPNAIHLRTSFCPKCLAQSQLCEIAEQLARPKS